MKKAACAVLAVSLISSFAAPVRGQTLEDDRRTAFDLVKAHNYLDALPLLEKLAKADPEDMPVLEDLGKALLMSAVSLTPGSQARRARRIRARETMLKAQQLGSKDTVIADFAARLPANGSDVRFSKIPAANTAMNDGEAAFAVEDDEAALAAFSRAAAADPALYEAPLFAGDIALRMDQLKAAGEWFTKAIAINPNRETAYRYWAQGLLEEELGDDALDRFVDAIIAEPYTEVTWHGLGIWGQTQGVALGHPEVNVPRAPADRARGRTTLQKEAEALRNFAKTGTDESAERIILMDSEGVLEAFVLLARPDAGIVKDYPSYRAAHRDAIRRYVMNFVIQF